MAKFHEIFCQTDFSNLDDSLLSCICPLSNSICDGGGNRHQTTIKGDSLKLIKLEINNVKEIIPAVCSIKYNDNTSWVVCPRRLFSYPKGITKKHIASHERKILEIIGVNKLKNKAIYSEVYLQLKDDDADINYHFDYVVAGLHKRIKIDDFLEDNGIDSIEEMKKFKKLFKNNKMIDGEFLINAPNLNAISILEVMTASTSGSNTSKGTDIKSSFIKAINNEMYDCPGINKRQVWGRMATQLFAKSSLAESWGAKTYWIVQDELLKNIANTTKLKLDDVGIRDNTINFISMKYDDSQLIEVDEVISIHSGVSMESTGLGIDILLPKKNPTKKNLLESLIRREPSAILSE